MRNRGQIAVLMGVALLVSVVFAQQTEEPDDQPTLDAAVQALFDATASAEGQIGLTQTVDAAFSSAQTATALANATPTPTAFSIETLEVVGTQELDLIVGMTGRSAHLAPDGESFAYYTGEEVCRYTLEGVSEGCIAIGENIRGLVGDSIYWSPDSRYLTMTEDFFRLFVDPDIWLVDTVDGTLVNLTDDGVERVRLTGEEEESADPLIDVVPRWVTSEQIAFVRYTRSEGINSAPLLYTINIDGTGLEDVRLLSLPLAFPVYAMAVSPDGRKFAYNLYIASTQDTRNGLWMLDLDSGTSKLFTARELYEVPSALEFSPDGQYVISIGTPGAQLTGTFNPQDSGYRVHSVEGGAPLLIDENRYVEAAGWSPTGSALAYIVRDPINDANSGLYLASAPGEPGRLVLAGEIFHADPLRLQTLDWGANNVILLARAGENKLVAVQLGE